MTIMRRGALLVAVLVALGGCAPGRFVKHSKKEMRVMRVEMRADPQPLERPVIVVGGYLDTGLSAGGTARRIRWMTSADPRDFLVVAPTWDWTFENAAKELVEDVERRFGEGAEVDVVAISMGGLVSRLAAMDDPERA